MKILLIFLILYTFNKSLTAEENWFRHSRSAKIDLDHYVPPDSGTTGSANVTKEDDIERPCSDYNIDCVRSFFAHNSQCSPVYGSISEPFNIKQLLLNLPHANVTVTINDAVLTGLNKGIITEFYINKKKNLLVMGVEFKKFIIFSSNTIISYHRKDKEPIVTTDMALMETKNLSLTLTIQNATDIKLTNSFVYTFVTDFRPLLVVGAALEDLDQEGLSVSNLVWRDNSGLSVREAFLVQGPMYMNIFLQSKICDFTRFNNKKE